MSQDKKIFNDKSKLGLKSKHFTENVDKVERQNKLKYLINRQCRRLNNKERIELINLLYKKDNLTNNTLSIIIQLKEEIKLNKIELNNHTREMEELEKKLLEKRKEVDNCHFIIENHSLRLNKFLTKY